ncbi:pectinesterase family protein [Kitasatospora sp. NBC_00315]|uniref:pectinesterase family protein n=1 Tax=Kitasatospora sp. NBC_00315 TaxID=2975963 RepID=UPI003244F51A
MFVPSDRAPSEARPPAAPAHHRAPAHRRTAGLLVALLLAVCAALAGGAVPAGAVALPAAGTYQLVVTKSGKCVDVPAASGASGALLQQWGCTDGAAWQQFVLTPVGSGSYQLVNAGNRLCVDVPGGSTASGVQLQQWGCGAGQTNQLWSLTPSGSGTFQIVNARSGLCVSDQGASTANGAAVIQETCTANTNKQWAFRPVTTATPTVASDGTGRYRTVQAAVDAVAAGNTGRVIITIKPGTYREQVTVPATKPYITLQGLGGAPEDVVIVNNRNAGSYGTAGSATLLAQGHDFTAAGLTLSNDFDENSSDTGDQALALYLDADRTVLDDVRLLGDQDTFLVNDSARAYVVNSYVEGTVDFVYGSGVAVFSGSRIHEKRTTGGPVTAAATPAARAYGFLFYRSTITGATANTTQLGRPWRQDAQVVYRECSLSDTIATAQPWTNMSTSTWQNARYFEYRNTGAGAGTNANRPQLTDAQAAAYTPQKYLAGTDGWNPVG